MAKVIINDKEYDYKLGTSFLDIANDVQDKYSERIILADVNGKLTELSKKLGGDCRVVFKTTSDTAGFKTFRRTATFILIKAVSDIYKNSLEDIKIEFAIGNGIFCSLSGGVSIDDKFLSAVSGRITEIINADLPIEKSTYSHDDAVKIFEDEGMPDKVKLFKYRRTSKINIYSLDNCKDYFYGYMAPSTGYVTKFKLYKYADGFVMQLPGRRSINELSDFEPLDKVFAAMREADIRGRELNVETVGQLNDCICNGNFDRLKQVMEAIQEGRMSDIAKDIIDRGSVKFVMIAGPSSSGKTTFSYRLSTQLMAHGLSPHPIGLDNYYKNRDETPVDENGNYDFECLEALDVEGFNNDMKKLLAGETVELPTFNFKTGRREYNGNYMTLKENDILVIEGIHGLNEKMSYILPKESKYKIYISAITSLNIDAHNRISTTDVRLIRRMVRDNRTRNTKAEGTLAMWDSVRRGEEKYIFPFQESADAVFNSALLYELAVLKQFAEPLLFNIDKSDPTYHEANRLLKFLDYFLGVTSEGLPNNSILREFVGGSIYNV